MIEVIAEIGVNHNGDVMTAIKLCNKAKWAGADVAKFQVWKSENVYSGEEYERMKKLELSYGDLAGIKAHCDSIGIEFMATPDEYSDALFLKEIGVKRIKIGSQNVLNLSMLSKVAALGLPIILSTGAATEREVHAAVRAIIERPATPKLTLLHCVAAYPAPVDQMNLRALKWLKHYYFPVGLSDHTLGERVALVALGLGATVFEKHLTLDRHAEGPDHAASMEPNEFAEYCMALRIGNDALGDGQKRIMPCEMKAREKNFRVLSKYAREAINAYSSSP